MLPMLLGSLFLIICILLIVVVLLQKGRGGGLSAAFGGMGSSAFGTRVGDVFTWVTIVLTALFLLLAIGTTMLFRPQAEKVATPGFSPAPGEFDEPVHVTIICTTPGVDIYYTTDGSEPKEGGESSSLYESAVRIAPPGTLMARAYRVGGWTPSDVAVGYYGPAPPEPATQPDLETSPAPGDLHPQSAPVGQSTGEPAS